MGEFILLVDAYDTPMLKGCEYGYADEILAFTDTFFLWSCENLTGGGAHLERYLLMGVTCIDVIRPWLSNKEVVLVLKKLFDYETITIKTYDSEIYSYNPRCGIFSNVYTYLLAAGYLQIVSVARESYPWKYTLRANVEATHALWDFVQGTKEASLQTKRR